jgi:hypothetical protein
MVSLCGRSAPLPLDSGSSLALPSPVGDPRRDAFGSMLEVTL